MQPRNQAPKAVRQVLSQKCISLSLSLVIQLQYSQLLPPYGRIDTQIMKEALHT